MSKIDARPPTEIVKELVNDCVPYEKYRKEFKSAYNQLMSNVGLDETDWTQKTQKELRCANLHHQLRDLCAIVSGHDKFLAEIKPIFEAAIAVENDYHQQMKKPYQLIYDFYNNQFDARKREISELAPVLEQFQKNRPKEPEKIQQMDKANIRFNELQKLLKQMIEPGIESTQQSHLKAIREVTDLFEAQHEKLAAVLAALPKLPSFKEPPKVEKKEKEKEKEKASKQQADDEKTG